MNGKYPEKAAVRLLLCMVFCGGCVTDRQIRTYEPYSTNAVISGTVKVEQHYGPPNYGLTPETDSIARPYILFLDEPVRLYGDYEPMGDGDPYILDVLIHEVHLVPRRGMKIHDGDWYKLRGQFFAAHSGHHHRDWLLDIFEVIKKDCDAE